MNWRVILAIAQKDILDAVKNLYLAFALILPIGLALIMRLVMPGPNPADIPVIAIFDQGNSQLVQKLSTLESMEVRKVGSEQEAINLAKKEAVGSLVIPAGFDAALQAGEQPELVIYQNQTAEASKLAGFQRVIETQVLNLAGIEYPARIQWNGAPIFNEEKTSSSGSDSGFSISLYMLGLFLVMGLAMAGVFMVPYLMVEEKEKHTLDALLLSPARPVEVIAGKAIVGLFYSLILGLILLSLSDGWTGDWPISLLAVFLGALFVVGVGLLLGSGLSTMHQVNTWSSILMLALMLPSWIGIFSLPSAVETLFKLFPTYYLPETLNLSLAGEASMAVWRNLGILAGSALLVYIVVVWVLGKRARA